MAKLAPRDLVQVLSELPPQPSDANVLVGYEKADDAGVFRLRDDVALVQTVDFFTPIADDPETYGRIAAINSLNDIYAMGGRPLTALALVCYPQKEEMSVLKRILSGGQRTMNEEGVIVLGGHSVDDDQIKFGYAVTGLVHPDKVVKNSGAKPGDLLILTKPLGTGAITTAIKRGVAKEETVSAAMRVMTQSAARAAEMMVRVGAHACTDITGFGLIGHAYELARASGVSLRIEAGRVPLLPDVLELISQGMLTRGDRNNRAYVGDAVEIAPYVSREMQSALFDPQTAGGLLISLSPAAAEEFIGKVEAYIIGEVIERDGPLILVV
ncbi:MAG: selenide, water dikinase SelD [Pyrinomonas methylaliphatogenes]|uniref:Selenide, water dikinase n=1 Tax=Pyrinomonas methylaliphatogenes TaxID=454194 RepID=A0A0B6X1B4_9BACT|nr:selenide, water dikinase SelD [Pyrinomonas methylaliphatogenes]MBX5478520.1 selenide, water dikinase SelD [Pyrinomonas methylaliphatogenes]CDM66792.1 selenophosphate synthase [Pyrinomonas methylaliphatogenes]